MAGSGSAHLRNGEALLRVGNLVVEFPVGGGRVVHAVSDMSLDVLPGETVGLVGESGSGKSTTGHAIVQLVRPKHGSVVFDGVELTELRGSALREARARLQMIFQDPIASLNPWRKIADIVEEPLKVWRRGDATERRERVREMLELVSIDPDVAGDRKASQLSGGQCQRVSIARTLMIKPELIICDEPVAALDVSVQAQIINLLDDLKSRLNLSLLFIAHDLAVVKKVSDRVVVMYMGKICEVGTGDHIYTKPFHPYTRLLLDAIPEPDPDLRHSDTGHAAGELPSAITPPSGCRFHTRCERGTGVCRVEEPAIRELAPGHFAACHHPYHAEAEVVPVEIVGSPNGASGVTTQPRRRPRAVDRSSG